MNKGDGDTTSARDADKKYVLTLADNINAEQINERTK